MGVQTNRMQPSHLLILWVLYHPQVGEKGDDLTMTHKHVSISFLPCNYLGTAAQTPSSPATLSTHPGSPCNPATMVRLCYKGSLLA